MRQFAALVWQADACNGRRKDEFMAPSLGPLVKALIVASMVVSIATAAHAQGVGERPRFDRMTGTGTAAGGTDYRPDLQLPKDLEGIGIEDKHGAPLPRELQFVDQDGKAVRLGDYTGEKPFILVLAYYDCPMLCSLVLNQVTERARDVGFDLGSKYRIVTVSFDTRDTPAKAAAKRQTYLDAYGKPLVGERGWDFLTQIPGDTASIKTLADRVGFHYRWDADTQQFAHAAGVFVFTPGGQLSRVFYGIDYRARDLRLGLVEASEGKLGSAWDQVLLFCYHYEPRGYTVAVLKLMRLGAGLTVLIIALWLGRMWRRDRRRRTERVPA
jgi:protein SCO1